MARTTEIACLVLVGACWGCTNPLLRKGSIDNNINNNNTSHRAPSSIAETSPAKPLLQRLLFSLRKFLSVGVWLPYLLNQAGSLLFYYTLARSDLSLAVPICNALGLVFSIVTSYLIGERIEQPLATLVGSGLIMAGVTLCLVSRADDPANI